jgi:hypothetical protein
MASTMHCCDYRNRRRHCGYASYAAEYILWFRLRAMGWRYLGVVFLLIAGLVYLTYTSLLAVSSDPPRRLNLESVASFIPRNCVGIYAFYLLLTIAVENDLGTSTVYILTNDFVFSFFLNNLFQPILEYVSSLVSVFEFFVISAMKQ